MASVYEKAGKWYMRVKDSTGKWRDRVTQARTKTEARRLADELERKSERQRLGMEERPAEDGGGTLGALLEWWLETYIAGKPSFERTRYAVRAHLLASELAPLRLVDVTPGRVESFLQAKGRELAPGTVNHIRRFVLTAFYCAKRAGRYVGKNPAAEVRQRKVPRRVPDFLKPEEVPSVLGALHPRWRPLFATAIYTGLRKGELLALRKVDADLTHRLLTVARSWDRDTTKGGHAEVIPIAAELVPYLQEAVSRSPSELVFPGEDGGMRVRKVELQGVLRRAMARAGIAQGYRHVCRAKGCGHAEDAPDATLRACAKCGKELWAKARVRPIRFHDLRHTTASLLMMSGANPAAVQRIMRHSDPRITTETYGHLTPNYLRAEVDRLVFGLPVEAAGAPASRTAGALAAGQQGAAPFAATLLQTSPEMGAAQGTPLEIPQGFQGLTTVQGGAPEATPSLSRTGPGRTRAARSGAGRRSSHPRPPRRRAASARRRCR
jgi:integrase